MRTRRLLGIVVAFGITGVGCGSNDSRAPDGGNAATSGTGGTSASPLAKKDPGVLGKSDPPGVLTGVGGVCR